MRWYDGLVMVVGIGLLVISAFIVVPALTYVGYLKLKGPWEDPAGIMTYYAWVAVGLGACVGAIGGAAVFVGGRKAPR